MKFESNLGAIRHLVYNFEYNQLVFHPVAIQNFTGIYEDFESFDSTIEVGRVANYPIVYRYGNTESNFFYFINSDLNVFEISREYIRSNDRLNYDYRISSTVREILKSFEKLSFKILASTKCLDIGVIEIYSASKTILHMKSLEVSSVLRKNGFQTLLEGKIGSSVTDGNTLTSPIVCSDAIRFYWLEPIINLKDI